MFPRIIAHCGDGRHAPESTLPAFEEAIRRGADGIEFDAHLTADGELVVHHDYQLGRVFAGRGPIAAMTLAEVKKVSLCERSRERIGKRYKGIGVPTLAEVLDLGRGRVRFELDLRTPDLRLLQCVVAEVRRLGIWEDVEVTSEHVPLLSRAGEDFPTLRTGIFFGDLPAYLTPALGLAHVCGWLTLARANVAHLPLSRIDADSVAALHDAGFLVHGANLNDAEAIQACLGAGIDQFTTDDLDLALALRNAAPSSDQPACR